jgi:hypothetical protein
MANIGDNIFKKAAPGNLKKIAGGDSLKQCGALFFQAAS